MNKYRTGNIDIFCRLFLFFSLKVYSRQGSGAKTEKQKFVKSNNFGCGVFKICQRALRTYVLAVNKRNVGILAFWFDFEFFVL